MFAPSKHSVHPCPAQGKHLDERRVGDEGRLALGPGLSLAPCNAQDCPCKYVLEDPGLGGAFPACPALP